MSRLVVACKRITFSTGFALIFARSMHIPGSDESYRALVLFWMLAFSLVMSELACRLFPMPAAEAEPEPAKEHA